MRSYLLIGPFLALMTVISSCEFSCKLGAIDEKEAGGITQGPVRVGNALVYNNIQLTARNVALNKAYLVFANGERVPHDNIVDFKSPVKLILLIDSGWTVNNGKVLLGGSERVTTESGELVLEEKDMFTKKDGVSEEDARIIGFSVSFTVPPGAPPTSFKVEFRAWDKNSDAYIQGHYRLYSK